MARRDAMDRLAAIQARQLGLVTVQQAWAEGIANDVLRNEARLGRFRRVRRGVYASAAAEQSYEQELLAAVLAASTATKLAAVSHESGAHFVGLPLPEPDRPPFEVTTALDRKPVVEGVRLHRSGHLTPLDIHHVRGVPVTTATRTIIDLSMRLEPGDLGRLLDEALRRRLTNLSTLQRQSLRLRSAPGRSMHRVLDVIRARTGEDTSESMLEAFTLAALRRFGVRAPVLQHPVTVGGGRRRRIDMCYPPEKRAIEALGYEYHGLRSRFDDDAVRGNELVLCGYVPLYVTSAMTDWEVAALVAEAIGDPVPARPPHERTFAEWKRRRYAA